jgi:hypothetical protein
LDSAYFPLGFPLFSAIKTSYTQGTIGWPEVNIRTLENASSQSRRSMIFNRVDSIPNRTPTWFLQTAIGEMPDNEVRKDIAFPQETRKLTYWHP